MTSSTIRVELENFEDLAATDRSLRETSIVTLCGHVLGMTEPTCCLFWFLDHDKKLPQA